jgi:hypothetical protein
MISGLIVVEVPLKSTVISQIVAIDVLKVEQKGGELKLLDRTRCTKF